MRRRQGAAAAPWSAGDLHRSLRAPATDSNQPELRARLRGSGDAARDRRAWTPCAVTDAATGDTVSHGCMLENGESVDLDVAAQVPACATSASCDEAARVHAHPAEGNIGTITPDGVFTASTERARPAGTISR